MAEIPSAPTPPHEPTPEFDPTLYPERVSGFAMPMSREGFVEVEIVNSLGDKELLEVPGAAVQRLNMPRLSISLPSDVREPFEKGIGLAMIRCRREDQQADLARISVPTTGGESSMIIATERFVRRVNPPTD